jgi:hypothetical protein
VSKIARAMRGDITQAILPTLRRSQASIRQSR